MRLFPLYILVLLSGSAALSWEVVWQILASLSIGVSATGTAVTLAATMGGMSLGALWMARFLTRRSIHRPLVVYGLCELVIGIWGLVIEPAFRFVEACDESLYANIPDFAPTIHLALIFLVLAIPTMAMGATIPVLGLVSQRYQTSLAGVYAINTAGAAMGCLVIAFVFIPAIGVGSSIQIVAGINLVVFLATVFMAQRSNQKDQERAETLERQTDEVVPFRGALWVAAMTGFSTFALEVAWFRSLRSAFQSTTDTFAIILAVVLISLAIGGRLATRVRRNGWSMPMILAGAGILIIAVTPGIERFDLLDTENDYWTTMLKWTAITMVTVGPPVIFLGVALPWLLDGTRTPQDWGRLYAVNTLGAIGGALVCAWIFLPVLGFARSSWLIGLMVAGIGIALMTTRSRWALALLTLIALGSSVYLESGIGRDRIQIGNLASDYQILDFKEGPDATTSIVELKTGDRGLFIDGFLASSGEKGSSYMAWMGHLPALLHPKPQRGLVICFGTGQTANALRQEPTQMVDVVELSSAVISMAHHFNPINHRVLDDPKVTTTVMDGRAWLRRTTRQYDVITLEPMPPNFAGVNALYSMEFYRLAAERMNHGGVIAQWVPYHLLTPHHSMSVAKTFATIFPDSILWLDPVGRTGILLGRKGTNAGDFGHVWPGLERPGPKRPLPRTVIRRFMRLDSVGLKRYIRDGNLVTDDNQRLAYSDARRKQLFFGPHMLRFNLDLVERARRGEVIEP